MRLFQNGTEELLYFPQFADKGLFTLLEKSIVWRQNEIRIFGKNHMEPRLTAWFGPPYTYSSIAWPAMEIPQELKAVMRLVKEECAFPFNAVLCNFYRHGNDSMGWHRDNEPEINQECIASLSLGSARKFVIRERRGNHKIELMLGHGDLLIMRNMQENWEHAIMKTALQVGPRINLTFREVVKI